MNLKAWIHSILAAAIGGGVTSLSAILISPASFTFTTAGWEHIGEVFLAGAIPAVLAVLKQSPLPGSITDPAPGGVQAAGKPVSVVVPAPEPTVLIASTTTTTALPPSPPPPPPPPPAQ